MQEWTYWYVFKEENNTVPSMNDQRAEGEEREVDDDRDEFGQTHPHSSSTTAC